MSGVKVDQECINTFNTFKLGKNHAYVVFGFSQDLTKIVVQHAEEKKAPANDTARAKNSQWEDLISMFPKDDVRYAVVDVHFNLQGAPRTEIVFITWAPETANIKRRMLIASSSETLKKSLVGCKTYIQATCYPDLALEEVVDKLKGTLD